MKAANNWKNQLHNRKISPSDEVWLNIEEELESKEKNKLKTKFILSLIAACLVGCIVFISLPTQQKTQSISNIAPVSPLEKETHVFPEALFIADTESNTSTQNNTSKSTSASIKTENKKATTHQSTTDLETSLTSTNKISVEAQKLLAEVEAEISSTKSKPALTTQMEVEQLLADAQQLIQEVDYKKLHEFATSENLLADVEKDLSKSNLQNRVWQFVKDNMQNLESAIASLR
jgi:hypothetical protein